MISPLKTSGLEGLAGGKAGFTAAAGATGPRWPLTPSLQDFSLSRAAPWCRSLSSDACVPTTAVWKLFSLTFNMWLGTNNKQFGVN